MDALLAGGVAARRTTRSLVANLGQVARRSSLTARGLVAAWSVFSVLVQCGVHGSSMGALEEILLPGTRSAYYPLAGAAGHDTPLIRSLCLAQPRIVRGDEFLVWTPYALSQIAHRPRFPVVNELVPGGQNMLLIWNAPVAHIATLARPATWGYFLFGARRGLAWQWWIGPIGCFTVLWLLFRVVLRGRSGLAAFGAAWFCASAHTVAWSQMPAYDTALAALCCLCAYRIVADGRTWVIWLSAVLLGLGLAGFVMVLYPPWQVVLAYFFGLLFLALIIRDRPWRAVPGRWVLRSGAAAVAVIVAGGLVAAWARDCWDAIQAMAASWYPGQRFSFGGGFPLPRLFSGWFDLAALYGPQDLPGSWINASHAASFFHFFPAVLLARLLVPGLCRSAGPVTWAAVLMLAWLLAYCFVGFPEWLARATLMSRCHEVRCDLGLGLVSIVLTLDLLATRPATRPGQRWAPYIVGAAMAGLCVGAGWLAQTDVGILPGVWLIAVAAAVVGLATFALVAGRARLFAGIVLPAAVGTGMFFNPLARGLVPFERTKLSEQIVRLNAEAPEPAPLWVCYGGRYTGLVVSANGGRSPTGISFHPTEWWRELDPARQHQSCYDCFTHVSFRPGPSGSPASFRCDRHPNLDVTIPWDHPALVRRGVRYVLYEQDYAFAAPTDPRLRLRYRSERHGFLIYEVVSHAPPG